MSESLETATFGAGCFWGVQDRFDAISGVKRTTVGYMGGDTDNPSYRDVCDGDTGHAEVVKVEYDPARVEYDKLLNVFFDLHHPIEHAGTHQRNRGASRSQYRAVAFWYDAQQRRALDQRIEDLNLRASEGKVVTTQLQAAADHTFWRAEDYHQHYHNKH